MLSKSDIEIKLKEIKPVLADKFYVSRVGYFGSFASGNQTSESDLDLLVEFSRPVGWNFFALEQFLENYLGIPVDLITKSALKDRIRESILNNVHYV